MKLTPIAAIDLIAGQVVRLTQGDFNQKTTYSSNPVAVAKQLEQLGFERLHLVDLDGAKAGKPQQLSLLEAIARETSLKIDFGGGLRSLEDFEGVLNAGAQQVTLGSLAVENPALLESFIAQKGASKLLLAADVRNGWVVTRGWTSQSALTITSYLSNWLQKGVSEVFVTDVANDGALRGPNFSLYQHLLAELPQLQLIASGGIRGPGDVQKLSELGCSGAIIGKALYEEQVPRMRWIELLKKGVYAG
jgi:phosphoribosylformimino-5-aminoimidazole carboxamide ribotide isomerase